MGFLRGIQATLRGNENEQKTSLHRTDDRSTAARSVRAKALPEDQAKCDRER